MPLPRQFFPDKIFEIIIAYALVPDIILLTKTHTGPMPKEKYQPRHDALAKKFYNNVFNFSLVCTDFLIFTGTVLADHVYVAKARYMPRVKKLVKHWAEIPKKYKDSDGVCKKRLRCQRCSDLVIRNEMWNIKCAYAIVVIWRLMHLEPQAKAYEKKYGRIIWRNVPDFDYEDAGLVDDEEGEHEKQEQDLESILTLTGPGPAIVEQRDSTSTEGNTGPRMPEYITRALTLPNETNSNANEGSPVLRWPSSEPREGPRYERPSRPFNLEDVPAEPMDNMNQFYERYGRPDPSLDDVELPQVARLGIDKRPRLWNEDPGEQPLPDSISRGIYDHDESEQVETEGLKPQLGEEYERYAGDEGYDEDNLAEIGEHYVRCWTWI